MRKGRLNMEKRVVYETTKPEQRGFLSRFCETIQHILVQQSSLRLRSNLAQRGLVTPEGPVRYSGLPHDPALPLHTARHALSLLAKKVFDFVFPEEEGCVFCGKVVDLRHAEEVFYALICYDCMSRIPFVQRPICEACGRPLRGQALDINERGCSNTMPFLTAGTQPEESFKMRQFAKRDTPARRMPIGDMRIKNGRETTSQSGGAEARSVSTRNVRTTDTSATIEDTFDRLSTVDEIVCSDCGRQGRYFLRARAVGTYDGVLRELIREFKFYGRRDLAEGLGVLMAREVSREIRMRRCNVIVPVPLHPLRLAERGYNQAELLANEVGFCFGIRVQDSLARITGPGEQNKLGRQLRKNHVRGVFTVPYPAGISGKRVLLADDVITTGNTANECARALLRAGAAEVHVIAAAISPFEQEWLVHQGNETGAGCVELAWREQV